MKRSDSITKIAGALLKAQRVMGGATKGAANPYFKSKYADYGAVLEACKDLLNENGVLILQPHTPITDPATGLNRSYVETTLLHESGEFISSLTEVVCAKQNDPQAYGSAITYARRYGLQSLLAMPTEDDDGNSAANRTSAAKPTLVSTPKPAAEEAKFDSKAPHTAAPVAQEAAPAKKSSFKAKPAAAPAVAKEVGEW